MEPDVIYIRSLLKWELVMDMWDYDNTYKINIERVLKILPELEQYPSLCSFCSTWSNPQCHGCPLTKEWGHSCREIDSPFDEWIIAIKNKMNAEDSAKQIRDSVKKIYFKRGGEDYEDVKELLDRHSLL